MLPGVEALRKQGVRTGASTRNWASYGARCGCRGFDDWRRDLLTDPQTSGGLLIAVAEARAPAALELAHARGFAASRVVGQLIEGAPGITVTF